MPYSDEVLADEPLGYWKLDETSGTTITDSSGNGRHGTYSGAILGQAPLHAGSTAAAKSSNSGMGIGSIPAGAWADLTTAFTIEAWVKINTVQDVPAIVSRWNSSSGGWIYWQRSDRHELYLDPSATRWAGPPLLAGQTNHIVWTFDGAHVTVWVNGMKGPARPRTAAVAVSTGTAIQIGGYNGANRSDATVSDVALYDYALSDERIAAHAGSVSPSPTDPTTVSGLVANYDAKTITGLGDGDTVSSWPNSVSGGPALGSATGTPEYKPGVINTHPAVRFTRSSVESLRATVFTARKECTVLFVATMRTAYQQESVAISPAAGTNGSFSVLHNSPANQPWGVFIHGYSVEYTAGLHELNTPTRWILRADAVKQMTAKNGYWGGIRRFTLPFDLTRIMLGGGGTGYQADTDIGQVLVYDRALTDAEVAGIDAWLKQYWAEDTGVSIEPGAGGAVAGGHAPTVTVPVALSPGPGSAVAGGHAPTVEVAGVELSPGPGSAVAGGHAPTVTVPVGISAGAGGAVAGGHAPTVAVGGVEISAGAGGAVAGGHAPTVAVAVHITPGPGSAVAGGHAPAVALPLEITPGPGSAVAGGHAPSVDIDIVADGGWGWVGSVGSAGPAPDVVLEPPVVAPEAIVERPLVRVSHRLVLDQDPVTGEYHGDGAHEIVREVVGVPHLWVDGQDVTYFEDQPVKFGDITAAIPGGSRVASVGFPQVSVLEERSIPWLRPWAPAEISIVRPGGSKIVCFSGHLIAEAGGKGKGRNKVEWSLEGDLGAAGHINLKVPVALPPVDVGVRIPKLFNDIPGRRFHAIEPFISGIPTRKRGSYTDKVNGHAQDLLATAWTIDGNQLTIFPDAAEARRYHVGFKDLTPKWTISSAAPGIEVDLMWDWSQVVNAIYGYGSGPDGYAWAGWRFPGFVDYDPPDYPLPAGTSMRPGSSGAGVATWKTRLRELGWAVSTGSTYNSSDVAKVRAFQTERGILVDGVVGPQTWNEVWNLGPRDLVAPERFPLAVLPAVEPYLYSETGRVIGENPAFDPTVGRQEIDIAYGAGVTFAEGVADAQVRLARDSEPGLVGEIKMTSCPWEGSRWEIQEGDAFTLLQWRGMDPVLYVSQRKISLDGREVTLTVDTKARDAMTLVEIIKREREALADPARRPGAVTRSSRTEQDQVVEFDGESPAGRFPRIAIREGLWTVWCIPVSQVGRLVEVNFQTDSPIAEISVVLFGKRITANRLTALAGPPLSRDDPFKANAAELEAAGIIEGWGSASQPGGHWPGTKDDPATGRLRERSSTEYVSQIPPWIWVAVGSNVSTHVQGRIKPPPSMA